MNTDDVLGFVKKSLPWIGAAATGNIPALATMAAAAVSNALGVTVEATPGAVATAIAGATPEQMLALKQEDDSLAIKLRELGIKEAQDILVAELADTADARKRDTALMTVTGHTNLRASWMLVATLAALVLLVAVMLFREIDANTALGGVVIMLIGKFANAWDTAFLFEFGTNRSSKTKDETINSLTK